MATVKLSIKGGTENFAELAAMTSAGKKLIAQSLNNKGVTGITSASPLASMADAIDALNTNGVGGVNPNFPILIYPRSQAGVSSSYIYQGIMPNDYMYVCPGDDNLTSMNIYNAANFTLPNSNSSQNNYRVFRIDKAAVDAALGETLSTPFNMIQVPNTNNFVAFAGGKIVKIIPDYTNYTITATAVTLEADNDSSVSATTGANYKILAADFTTDQCLIWTGNNNGKVAWANMTTGAFRSENTADIFWKMYPNNITEIYNRQQPLVDYCLMHQVSDCWVIHINWSSIKNSIGRTTTWSNDSDACYDVNTNCFYFVSTYSSNTCRLITYDLSTDTFTQRVITSNMTGTMLGSTNIQSFSSHTFNSLAIINIPNTDYRLFYTNAYCFVLDSQDNLVPYIPGTEYYFVCTRYTYSLRSTPSSMDLQKNSVYVVDGNIYSIYATSGNNNFITLYKIDIKYNKVLAQQVIKNSQPVLYGTFTVITTSNIDDGPFDATTINMNVNIGE